MTESEFDHRRPQRRAEAPGALAGAGVVTVDVGRLARAAQHFGGGFQQAIDGLIIGLHERRQQFGHVGRAAPLVAGQQLDRRLQRGEDVVCTLQLQDEAALDRFSQAVEQGGVERDIAIGDRQRGVGVELIDAPKLGADERRVGAQLECQLAQRRRAPVGERQFAHHGHRVLL